MNRKRNESRSRQKGAGGDKGRAPWLEPIDRSELDQDDDLMRKTWMIAGTAIVVMVLFSGLIWYLYGRGAENGRPAPDLVKAPAGPTKIEPEVRGGMEVPHQDRLVFGRIAGEEEKTEEKIKEGPEEPLERPPAPADEVPPAKAAPRLSEPGGTMPPEKSPVEAPAPQARAPVALADSYRLQLGAFGDAEGARTSWRRLLDRHGTYLSGLSHEIEPVTIGQRTLYRLRAGPFASRAEAALACNGLKEAGQDCHVVVP